MTAALDLLISSGSDGARADSTAFFLGLAQALCMINAERETRRQQLGLQSDEVVGVNVAVDAEGAGSVGTQLAHQQTKDVRNEGVIRESVVVRSV